MGFDLGVMSAAVTLDDREYKNALGGLEGASESTFRKIAGLAAGYLSLRALYTLSQTAVRAFMVQQDAIEGVRATLRNLGSEVEETTARFAGFASSLQGKTVFGDETILANMSQGMRLGIRPEEIEDVTRSAIGLTAKLGVDLPTAMQLMAKASQGHTEALARYGIQLDANMSKEEQFRDLVRQGAESFPLAEAATKTASGQMQQFKNTVGDTAEVLGGQLWKALGGTVEQLNKLFGSFNNATSATQGLIARSALLATGLAVFAKTGFGQSLMTMRGSSQEERDAAAAKANEEVKRAAVQQSTAVMEEQLARQDVALAKNAVAAAENAEEHARAALTAARSKGDPAAIAAAETALMEAERNVTKARVDAAKAQQKLNEKTLAAKSATENYTQLSAALPGVLRAVALSQSAFGAASLFTAKGLRAAATAAKGFLASLGPIGWALMLATAAYMAFDYVVSQHKAALEAQAQAAEAAVAEQEKLIAANDRRRASEREAASRLQTLAKYERLNADEMAEAEKLIKQLRDEYGELDISLDKNTGKINANAVAWEKLGQKQREQAMDEQKTKVQRLREQAAIQLKLTDNDIGGWFSSDAKYYRSVFKKAQNSSTIGAIEELKYARDFALANKENADVEKIQKVIDVYEKLEAETRKLAKLQQGGDTADPADAEAKRRRAAELAKTNEERRRMREDVAETEWKIRFDGGDAEKQAAMLQEKIDKIFFDYKRRGRFRTVADFVGAQRDDMSKQELEDLKKIVELEAERNKLRKQSGDAFRQESESYDAFLRQREKQREDKAVEREIRAAEKQGTGVDDIFRREYEKARLAADMLKGQYEQAVKSAELDNIMSAEEQKRISELRAKLQEALGDADKWQDRIADHELKNNAAGQAVGDFSAAILAAQLGTNSPEKETAKNTKEMVLLQRRTLEKIGTTGGGGIKVD